MHGQNSDELRQRRECIQTLSDVTESLQSETLRQRSTNPRSSIFGRVFQYSIQLLTCLIGQLSVKKINFEPAVIMKNGKHEIENSVKFVKSLASIQQISWMHPELINGDVSTSDSKQNARSAFRFKERLRKRAYSSDFTPAHSRIREGTFELLSSPPESQCTLVALAMHAISIICLGHTLLKQVTVIYETRDSPFIETRSRALSTFSSRPASF